MSNERPARIAFAGGAGDRRSPSTGLLDDDDIQVVEEELVDKQEPLLEAAQPRPSSPKKPVPKWIFAVGGALLLVGVVGIGMLGMAKFNRMAAAEREEAMRASAPMVQQPAIQGNDVSAPPVANPGAPGELGSQAAAQVPAPAAVPIGAAPAPISAPVQGVGGRPGEAPVQSGAPTTLAAPAAPPAAAADAARAAVLESELVKTMARVEELTRRVAKLEQGEAQRLAASAAAAKSDSAKPAAAPVKAVPAAPAKPVAAPVAPPPAKPAPLAAKPVPAKPAAAVVADEAQPVAPPAKLQGYSVSSMIGTRAWLVHRNSDGTESELSVAPGEKIEGKIVTSVDGATRCVSIEGGQKICVGK